MTDSSKGERSFILKLPWQAVIWVVMLIFTLSAFYTTFEARSYVDEQIDKKMSPIGQSLTKIQVDQATILEWIRQQDNKKKNGG